MCRDVCVVMGVWFACVCVDVVVCVEIWCACIDVWGCMYV